MCMHIVLKVTSVSLPAARDRRWESLTGHFNITPVHTRGSDRLLLPSWQPKPPLWAEMEVAQASVVSPLCTLSGWWALGCAAGPRHCPSEGKKQRQDGNSHMGDQYTASRVPQMWAAWISTATSSRCWLLGWGRGGFHRDVFMNLGTSVLVWLCFPQLCSPLIWLSAPSNQGHRRSVALLMPSDGTDDTVGKCQEFASHFPRNGAIDDEDVVCICKFSFAS